MPRIELPRVSSDSQLSDTMRREPVVGCWGRTFKHWSQYIFAGAEAFSLGGVAYGYFEQNYFIVGMGGFFSLSECLAFYYVRKFRPEKSLEDRVKDLGSENMRLRRNIERLQSVRDSLKEGLKEAKSNVKQTSKMLSDKTAELGNVVSRLEKVNAALENLQIVCDQYREKTEQLAKIVSAFSTQNRDMSRYVQRMGKQTQELDDQADEIESGVGSMDRENTEMLEQTQELGTLVEKLENEMNVYQHLFSVLRELIQQVQSYVVQLDNTDDLFSDGVKKLEKVQEDGDKKFESILSSLLRLQMAELEETGKRIENIQHAFEPLKALFSLSREFVQELRLLFDQLDTDHTSKDIRCRLKTIEGQLNEVIGKIHEIHLGDDDVDG